MMFTMLSHVRISFDPEILRRARRRAGELGISLGDYVRRLVARDLERRNARTSVTAIFGLGSSGGADVARDKDRMIGEAVVPVRRVRND